MYAQLKPMLERRKEAPEQFVWWNKLSLAQNFSASSLAKFGYELTFVRKNKDSNVSLAVLQCSGAVAVISQNGDIDTLLNITIR
jgi:hypothetical protein